MKSEITLSQIFTILWDKMVFITSITLVGGIVAFYISSYMLEPMYTSRISMYVNNHTKRENIVANINDINASQKLVSTYIEILKSDTVLTRVLEETSLPYTISQVRSMLMATSISGTEILEVKVTSQYPQEATTIANTIGLLAPEEIMRVVKSGSVELIDKAVQPTQPTSPNRVLNTVIGMMGAAVLAVLGVLVGAMTDTRIKSVNDIKGHYELPVLGTIPDLIDANKRIK